MMASLNVAGPHGPSLQQPVATGEALLEGARPATPGVSPVDELKGRLDALVGLVRGTARPDLSEQAFCTLEETFYRRVEDMQALIPGMWLGPEPPPLLHNWVGLQALLASVSAIGWWPPHAHAGLRRMAACLEAFARRPARRKPGVPALLAEPPVAAEENVPLCRGPDFAHLQQWRAAALRKHREIVFGEAPSGDPLLGEGTCGAEDEGAGAGPPPGRGEPLGIDIWGDGAGAQLAASAWTFAEKAVRIESINVTSLRTAEAWLLIRQTAMFLQEHAIPEAQQGGWVKRAAARGYSLLLSPTDPEASQPRGGVAVLAPREYRPTEMPPATAAFARARALGRAMRAVLRVGGRVALPIYNVYGFPGGPPQQGGSWTHQRHP
jgi:hypothetical protein